MIVIYGLGLSFSLMIIAWLIYLRYDDPGIIDVFWGMNITMMGSLYLLNTHNLIIYLLNQCLLVLWGVRLSLFLFLTRIRKHKVDKRYQSLSHDWKNKKIGFFYNFIFQGILGWIITVPFYFISKVEYATDLHYFSCLLIISGIILETCADFQLYQFKLSHVAKVCSVGLWNYSRHPNYFFECLVWFGFSINGIYNFTSIFSLLSILTLFSIMWFITIPITEKQSLISRGDDYSKYQARVSCFLPWFNRAL